MKQITGQLKHQHIEFFNLTSLRVMENRRSRALRFKTSKQVISKQTVKILRRKRRIDTGRSGGAHNPDQPRQCSKLRCTSNQHCFDHYISHFAFIYLFLFHMVKLFHLLVLCPSVDSRFSTTIDASLCKLPYFWGLLSAMLPEFLCHSVDSWFCTTIYTSLCKLSYF
jgi:hypothetical protein